MAGGDEGQRICIAVAALDVLSSENEIPWLPREIGAAEFLSHPGQDQASHLIGVFGLLCSSNNAAHGVKGAVHDRHNDRQQADGQKNLNEGKASISCFWAAF
jgi:hypothetical protein